MLGLDWTELALIAVVAVVVIGPKDLPDAVRGVAKGIQKLRRMAGDLQTQLDEVVREAKLEDVRNQINEIRNFDFRSVVEKEIDKDGSLRKTFTEDPIGNPLRDAFDKPASVHGAEVTPPPAAADGDLAGPAAPPMPEATRPEAPAFVPPSVATTAAPVPPPFVPSPSVPPPSVAEPSMPATQAAAPAPAPSAPAGSTAA
jgi:sec-independent protein translocase protein TatB